MQAVILAGGAGRRLRPLTNDRPKPMVQVTGKPILEYTLSILPREIDHVILIVGYKKEKIQEYFGDTYKHMKLTYVDQPSPLGTADALLRAQPHLSDDLFLLLHSDDFYHPEDIASLIGDRPCIIVKEALNPERFGVCLLNEDGTLATILEKMENPPTNLVNIGIYCLEPSLFAVTPLTLPNGELNLAGQIGTWAKERPVDVKFARFWHPIGYPEDIIAAEQFVGLPVDTWRN